MKSENIKPKARIFNMINISKLLIIISILSIFSCQKKTTTKSYDGVTIKIMVDPSFTTAIEELGLEFTDKYKAKIEIIEVDLPNVADTIFELDESEYPDLFLVVHDAVGRFVSADIVEKFSLEEKNDLFLNGAVQGFGYNGDFYGVPLTTENIAFFRNPLLVPRAPKTISEMVSIIEDLESSNKVDYGYILQQGDPYHFYPLLSAFGGYIFKPTETGFDADDIGIDSIGGIRAAKWLENMVKDNHVPLDMDYDSMHSLFESGKTAMIITGPWALPRIKDSGIPYEIGPVPNANANSSPFLGIVGMMLSKTSKYKESSKLFVTEFLTSEYGMNIIFAQTGRIPAMKSVRENLIDPDLRAFAKAGENGIPMPNIPEMNFVWGSFETAIYNVTTDKEEANLSFKVAADQIRAAIKESN